MASTSATPPQPPPAPPLPSQPPTDGSASDAGGGAGAGVGLAAPAGGGVPAAGSGSGTAAPSVVSNATAAGATSDGVASNATGSGPCASRSAPASAAVLASSRRIQRLDEAVVNRIAAGEVVVRPASALKELIENSLDAGSTAITVTARSGGLKTLQIQDNGCGIAPEDMGIVCERFTTSKLTSFDDLQTMSTAAYVDSKLVALKPGQPAKPMPCAGVKGTTILVEDLFYNVPTRLKALKNPNDEYQRVLDVVSRYAIHCGGRGVAFTCKKFGSTSPDVHTQAKASVLDNIQTVYGRSVARELLPLSVTDTDVAPPRFTATGYVSNANFSLKKSTFILFINQRLVDCASLRKAISGVYSDVLPKHTHPFVYLSVEMPPQDVDVNVHPTKREVHFLHEPELLAAIQTAVAAALAGANTSRTYYTQPVLPGATPPAATAAGGGAHAAGGGGGRAAASGTGGGPSKPVRQLRNTQARMVPLVQADHDTVPAPSGEADTAAGDRPSRSRSRRGVSVAASTAAAPPVVAVAPHRTVRTDARAARLEQFMQPLPRADDTPGAAPVGEQPQRKRRRRPPQAAPRQLLSSICTLIAAVDDSAQPELQRVIRSHSFVGVVDANLSLIQHSTKLYLVNHVSLCKELFYQQFLRLFSHLHPFELEPPVPLAHLALVGMADVPDKAALPQPDQQRLAEDVAALLAEKGPMLQEYFAIGIDPGGRQGPLLTHLPRVVDGYTPWMAALPAFVLHLAWRVDWTVEIDCFDDVCRAFSTFYSVLPPPPALEVGVGTAGVEGASAGAGAGVDGAGAGAGAGASGAGAGPGDTPARPKKSAVDAGSALEAAYTDTSSLFWVLSHVLFPAIRTGVTPSQRLADAKQVVQVACTEQLYKIFERC